MCTRCFRLIRRGNLYIRDTFSYGWQSFVVKSGCAEILLSKRYKITTLKSEFLSHLGQLPVTLKGCNNGVIAINMVTFTVKGPTVLWESFSCVSDVTVVKVRGCLKHCFGKERPCLIMGVDGKSLVVLVHKHRVPLTNNWPKESYISWIILRQGIHKFASPITKALSSTKQNKQHLMEQCRRSLRW